MKSLLLDYLTLFCVLFLAQGTPRSQPAGKSSRPERSLTASQGRQTQARSPRATLHYISFLAELSGGTPPEKFIGRGDLTLKLTEKELGQLLKLTDRRNSETLSLKPEAEFNLLRTRLVVEQDAGSILLAVDQTGVVQISGVAYRLTPLEFVHLYNFLNRLAIYHGQEVEPEPRRKSAQPAPKHPKRTKKS